MKYFLGSILLVFFCHCSQPAAPHAKTNVPIRPEQINNVADTFHYKDLFEGTIDTVQEKEITGFYGTWKITEIAEAGGTILDEKKIKSQIGKKLILTHDSIWTNFLDDTSFSKNPEYSLEYLLTDNGDSDLRGTTYASGYRDCRKYVIFLRTSNLYLEVIHFAEIAHYYDGRIYFFTKEDTQNTAANNR